MISKNIFIIWAIIFLFSGVILADVPPDPGYTRVHPNLIFEASENFADFRFFLQTPIDIEEITVKKGETQTIDSSARGGPKRFVTLLAIPKSKLTEYGEKLSEEQLKTLHQSVRDKQIDGVIELVKHTFQKDVPAAEKNNWKNPKYSLEKDSTNGIKAVESGKIEPTKNQLAGASSESAGTGFGLMTIIAGILISLAVLCGGLWAIFRS
jgi:hypothetical protein